jgi:hypothetical protein
LSLRLHRPHRPSKLLRYYQPHLRHRRRHPNLRRRKLRRYRLHDLGLLCLTHQQYLQLTHDRRHRLNRLLTAKYCKNRRHRHLLN